MDSIFSSGTKFAVLIAGSLALVGAVDEPTRSISVRVEGVKNNAGSLRWCASDDPLTFPRCGADHPSGRAAITGGVAVFSVPVRGDGDIAIAVFHDANDNGKLDTVLGIPREGYGFSRNPAFQPRAPRFAEASIRPAASPVNIRIRYLVG